MRIEQRGRQDCGATDYEHCRSRLAEGHDLLHEPSLHCRKLDAERVARFALCALADEPAACATDGEHDDIGVAGCVDSSCEGIGVELGEQSCPGFADHRCSQGGELVS